MNDLHSLLSPFAALANATERERALISPLELAALDGQEIVLPRVSGRKSARLLAAEQAALQRAEAYTRHVQEREAVRPTLRQADEYSLPGWQNLPFPGEIFLSMDGIQLECIDVLFENTDLDDDVTPHLLLVLPCLGSTDDDGGTDAESVQTLD